MSKYVIDLRPDCKVVQQICESDGQLHISSRWVNYLEELMDYINEHFPTILQDEYDRGYKDGRNVTETQAHDDAYQRGLEDGKAVNNKGCEGCEYSDGVVQENFPCANCCNYYTNNWTKKEFVRGDVVVDEDGTRGIVVSSENNESNLLYVLFKGYRVPQSVVRKHYKKTGEHYDIDKFLDEVKGEGSK